MTARDGIVLDAALAAVVPRRCGYDASGRVLTHLPTPTGLRPVAEIVADVDTLRAEANARRVMAMAAYYGDPAPEDTAANLRAADALDAIAVRLMAPALVDAWHAQHPEATHDARLP